MEIIRGTSPITTSYRIPTTDTRVGSVTWKGPKGSGVLQHTISYDKVYVQATLPYQGFDGEVEISWNFLVPGQGLITEHTYFEIVTPILSNEEILEIHPDANTTEIRKVERAVRHIISAHTGQKFGRSAGVREVRGTGLSVLNLPERLLNITTVNGGTSANKYVIANDGYALRYFPYGIPPLKADYHGLHYTTNGVIHNPNNVRLGQFDRTIFYKINGEWGWKYIPEQVKEAARLLVNDYACADSNYRDKYLTSMTAADWRIQFHAGAFRNTGNVRADQLLGDFIISRGWAVI